MDKPRVETAQLYDRPETAAIRPVRHVNQHGFGAEGCIWQWAKQQGTRAIRDMGSRMFAEVVQELVTLGYGAVKLEKPLTYRSLKEMAN